MMASYVYSWGPRIRPWPADSPLRQLDRKGQVCELLARGSMNSRLVRFADGTRAVVSGSALRRVQP